MRGYILKESCLDLVALMAVSGGVASLYMWIKHVPSVLPRWLLVAFWVVVAVAAAADYMLRLFPFGR